MINSPTTTNAKKFIKQYSWWHVYRPVILHITLYILILLVMLTLSWKGFI